MAFKSLYRANFANRVAIHTVTELNTTECHTTIYSLRVYGLQKSVSGELCKQSGHTDRNRTEHHSVSHNHLQFTCIWHSKVCTGRTLQSGHKDCNRTPLTVKQSLSQCWRHFVLFRVHCYLHVNHLDCGTGVSDYDAANMLVKAGRS